jgi:hypothetical protein
MSSTPHPSIAATAHFVEAERILVALPLATKRGERDHQMQLALVNSVLANAASMLGPVQSQTIVEPADGEDQPKSTSTHREAPRTGGDIRAGRFSFVCTKMGHRRGLQPVGCFSDRGV